jgi:hypothetical protein
MTMPQPQPTTPPPVTAAAGTITAVPAMSNALLVGLVGIIVAGLVGLIGALLPWVSTTMTVGSASRSIQDSSLLDGVGSDTAWPAIAVLLGALILVAGSVYLFARRIRALLGIAAAASLLLLGLGVFEVIDLYRKADAVYDQVDRAMGSIPADIPAIPPIDFRDVLHFDPAPGLWMIVFAGLLGTVLASLMLVGARPRAVGASPGPAPVPIEPQTAVPTMRPAIPPTDGPVGHDSRT